MKKILISFFICILLLGVVNASLLSWLFGEDSEHDVIEGNVSKIIDIYNQTQKWNIEQSGAEESTLGEIEIAHDATADDQKGILSIKLNDGDDDSSPSTALSIDSGKVVMLNGQTSYASTDPIIVAGGTRDTAGNGHCYVDECTIDKSGDIG